MTIKTEFISKKRFKLIGILDDEQDMLESFSDYSSGYVCDVVSEIADNHIPIYNNDVWAGASEISEYIEDAIEEGIAPTESEKVNLVAIFQSGYYLYYQRSLYDNVDIIVFNRVADSINEYLTAHKDIEEKIDLVELEECIESETSDYDNNNRIEDLDDTIKEIVERINEGEFAL